MVPLACLGDVPLDGDWRGRISYRRQAGRASGIAAGRYASVMNAQRLGLRPSAWMALVTALALAFGVSAAVADPPPFSALTSGGLAQFLTEHDGVGVFSTGCDGTDAGTVEVGRLPAGSGLGETSPVLSANGTLYVKVLDQSTHYAELWAGDGSLAGSRRLTGLNGKYPDPQPFVYRGAVYFASYGLWTSDGTPAGTREISDGLGRDWRRLVVFGDRIYGFGGDDRLWSSDGTADGTAPVTSGPQINYGEHLTVADGAMYFTTSDPDGSIGVWRSDGTGPGTVELGKIALGSFPEGATYPLVHGLAVLHGDVYLSVDDGDHGAELWTVPGAGGSGRLVADLIPGRTGSNPRGLTVVGDHLLFVATDPAGAASPNTMTNLYVLPAQDGAPAALTPWTTCLEAILHPPSTQDTLPSATPSPGTSAPPPEQGASKPATRPSAAKLRAALPRRVRATNATVTLGTVRCPPLCGRVTLKVTGAATATVRHTLRAGSTWRLHARLTSAARRALARHRTVHLRATLTVLMSSGVTIRAGRTIAVLRRDPT
jgi:ELWxxDGT repeat protein